MSEKKPVQTVYRSDKGSAGRRIKFICVKCNEYNVETLDDNTGLVTVRCKKCGKMIGEIT